MIKFFNYILLLSLFFSITSCDDSPTDIEELEYNVAISFVIATDSVRQKALLSYVESVNSEYSNYANLIDSAEFYVNNTKMIHSSSNFYIFHSRDHYYNYYSDSLNLQIGDTVTLNVTKDNITIIGKTFIPGNFEIKAKNKTISWTKSSNAFYYFIEIENKERTFVWQTATEKLSVTIDDKDFIEDDYKISITAFDENYYNYYQRRITSAGIKGAYGIFSAVNRKTINAHLQNLKRP